MIALWNSVKMCFPQISKLSELSHPGGLLVPIFLGSQIQFHIENNVSKMSHITDKYSRIEKLNYSPKHFQESQDHRECLGLAGPVNIIFMSNQGNMDPKYIDCYLKYLAFIAVGWGYYRWSHEW